MEREFTRNPLIVFVVGLALLTVSMPALATHNSVGVPVSVAQADEVAPDGTLQPDIDRDGPLVNAWHTNLDQPRLDPIDQRGDRYTDCVKAGDVDETVYQAGLTAGGDSCYVGYLDQQLEYILNGQLIFNLRAENDGTFYPLNPEPGDDYCTGDGDPVTRAERIVNEDPECNGSGHTWYGLGNLLVDTDLLEAPTQGNGEIPGAGDLLGKEEGSGYNSLPLIFTPYVFLFGQPHPDTPEDERSGLVAGQGPFGPNPAEGGSPLLDLTGACGDRTADCELLTPTDIKLYDSNNGNLEGLVDDPRARLCSYRPQFALLGGGGTFSAENCGIFGDIVAEFVGDATAGGFGLPGAPPTWLTTQPGWFEAINIITIGELSRFGGLFHTVDKQQCATSDPTGTVPHLKKNDCDGDLPNGVLTYVAVNPLVPTPDHALWCVRPNILAEGDSVKAGTHDPGLYGRYTADAIDVDVNRPLFNSEYQVISDAIHDDLRGVLPVVEPTVRATSETAQDVIVGLIGFGGVTSANANPGTVVTNTADTVDGLVADNAPEPLQELYFRADPIERNDPLNFAQPFEVTREAGMACDALGLVQIEEEPATLDGDLIHELNVFQDTLSIKDPTLFTDGLPAREDETTEGAWMVDRYSFGGAIIGFLDTSEDADEEPGAQFSRCATGSGQPQPDADFCTWRPLWDAYNPECTDIQGDPCSEILEERNYDLDAGVGLYAVARISGPVVVADEDLNRPEEITARSAVLGLDNPTAQNCIVGFSVGLSQATAVDAEAIVQEACADSGGETFVIEDAFDDQGGPGGFSAAIDLLKLAPTPTSMVEATGVGAGDGICVTSLLSVLPGEVSTDTEGLGALELDGGAAGATHGWTDCVPFASTA